MPLALGAGTNFRLPAVIDAAEITWLSDTPVPLSSNDPAVSSDEMTTDANASGGESFGSLYPKSASTKVCDASSLIVTVLSAPDGASFTDVTLTVIVFGVW